MSTGADNPSAQRYRARNKERAGRGLVRNARYLFKFATRMTETPCMPTVLIVDDEPDMRMLIRASIEMSVDVVGEAGDGDEGLQMWRALGGTATDIVILDNQMPGMTGLDVATEMLRERPAQVIVLYSSYLDPEIRSQAAEIGIAHCLPKHDFGLLASLLDSLSEDRHQATPPR